MYHDFLIELWCAFVLESFLSPLCVCLFLKKKYLYIRGVGPVGLMTGLLRHLLSITNQHWAGPRPKKKSFFFIGRIGPKKGPTLQMTQKRLRMEILFQRQSKWDKSKTIVIIKQHFLSKLFNISSLIDIQ